VHDPVFFPEPHTYDPTRFLDEKGGLRVQAPSTHGGLLAFGHGRRVCAGRDFAMNSIFIACAYMLWAFEFQWPLDEDGNQITCRLDEVEDHSLLITPREFGLVLVPRHSNLEASLAMAMKD
jgi:cytochrome P450